MTQRLLVTEPFGDYERGDRITGAAKIAQVVKTHPHHVLRETVPEKPKRKSGPRRAAPAAKATRKPATPAPAPAAAPAASDKPATPGTNG